MHFEAFKHEIRVRLASGVHDCLCRNLIFEFFLLASLGRIDGVGSSVFTASIEVDMKRPVRSIGDHLRSQNLLKNT